MHDRNKSITDLLNETITALTTVIPFQHQLSKPQLMDQSVQIQFGIFIGVTNDIRRKLLLDGERRMFSNIGESMLGMVIDDSMLPSRAKTE